MNDWMTALRDDLHHEFNGRPPTAVLATIRWSNGNPTAAARTVVVREIDPTGAILIASDSRSEKNSQVRRSPAATLVFWCASVKRQYRVFGPADLPAQPRQRIWLALSDRARALFTWPAPGTSASGMPVAQAVPAETPMPANFELLRLMPETVETLDLAPAPHVRMVWNRAGQGWSAESVNP